jgi:hypothetical protein
VDLVETVEKIVIVTNIEERLVEVATKVQVPIIQEVVKEITNQTTVHIKGDLQEKIV